ncbi:MAG: glycerate kinase [Chlamydiota bacterium]
MKIVLAPQSFKGSFSGKEICDLLSEEILKAYPSTEIIKQPVGDGGDGTLSTLIQSLSGTYKEPSWGFFSDTNIAYIESAAIGGVASFDETEKNPLTSTSYGLGQCLLRVIDEGYKHIIIGLGGSATNDGGAGLLNALGVKFLGEDGISLPLGGGNLLNLASIDMSELDPRLKEVKIEAACDVNNPLLGPQGATMVYAEQKGASEEDKQVLEQGLERFATLTKRFTGIDISDLSYSGAAGGIAGGAHAFLGAKLVPGAELVLDLLGFDTLIQGADLVITGEGRIDKQTVYDKAPIVVAQRAKKQEIRVVAVVGSYGEGYEDVFDHGIDSVIKIGKGGIVKTIEKILQK